MKIEEETPFFSYDVALIKLDKPFEIIPEFDISQIDKRLHVCPICLPGKNTFHKKAELNKITILGMGAVNKKGGKVLELQYAKEIKRISPEVCYKKWHPGKNPLQEPPSKKEIEADRGFCVRGENKEIICTGDEGSPAIAKYKNAEYLIGIAYVSDSKCSREWMTSSTSNLPKKSVKPSKYITIQGAIYNWLESEAEKGGKEAKDLKYWLYSRC